MSRGQPSCELNTDVSNEGWGPVFGTQSRGGLWDSDKKCFSGTLRLFSIPTAIATLDKELITLLRSRS